MFAVLGICWVSGDLRLTDLKIDPEVLDPEDVEMLQDMIIAATNDEEGRALLRHLGFPFKED